jgi:hypothetical protein
MASPNRVAQVHALEARLGRFEEMEVDSSDSAPLPYEWMAEIQAEQALRDSIAELPAALCQANRNAFFETPPIPYQQARRGCISQPDRSLCAQALPGRLRARLQTGGFVDGRQATGSHQCRCVAAIRRTRQSQR